MAELRLPWPWHIQMLVWVRRKQIDWLLTLLYISGLLCRDGRAFLSPFHSTSDMQGQLFTIGQPRLTARQRAPGKWGPRHLLLTATLMRHKKGKLSVMTPNKNPSVFFGALQLFPLLLFFLNLYSYFLQV